MTTKAMAPTGKTLRYEETFRSASVRPTKESAMRLLDEIRSIHSANYGWVEIDAWIEQVPGGGYRAVRHHAQYK